MTTSEHVQLRTLLDLLPVMERLGRSEAIRYNNGYRTFVWTYDRLLEAIGACAAFFDESGLTPGQRILLWGENRPEWIAAFWAALSRGLQVVPVDPAASSRFVSSIQSQTKTSMLVHSENLSPEGLQLPGLRFFDLKDLPAADGIKPIQANPDDPVEIVFTSGTTGDPKGIVHTHANICADLRPLRQEIHRFRRLLFVCRPLRLVSILPLSHMFGQALGLYVPILMKASIVLIRELNPKRLTEIISREKAAALITVPGHLTGLRDYLEARHDCSRRMIEASGYLGFLRRWLHFRDVHRRFGWRFLAFVVGGAQLRPTVERWWFQLGFLVIQGYGLTEASPVVSLNNPLKVVSGSLGKVLEGQSVHIAEDGEILVRGENVARYFGSDNVQDTDAWLPTGDIGRIDEDGNLYFLGRKKDVIVTRDGYNVYPEDVEAVLLEMPEVSDCAVVGRETDRGSEVHAAVIPAQQATDTEDLIKRANSGLETHQRIRSASIWPDSDFPRTPSTGKIKRNLVARRINRSQSGTEEAQSPESSLTPLQRILARFTSADPESLSDESRLDDDLGLSSLDRVELLSLLEEELGLDVAESTMTSLSTVGQLKELLARPASSSQTAEAETAAPAARGSSARTAAFTSEQPGPPADQETAVGPSPSTWSRRFPSRMLRWLFQELLLLPGYRLFMGLSVRGKANLEALSPPVLFAANHTSHLDTLSILDALPSSWRRRLAPAMLLEYFTPLIQPDRFGFFRRLTARTEFLLLSHLLSAYPLPQRMGGVRRTLRFSGLLAEQGYCPLLYPEGSRTKDGLIQTFQPGVGLMAKQLDLPVVPIRIQGLFELFSVHHSRPHPGHVQVTFGEPVFPSPDASPTDLSSRLESRIRQLGPSEPGKFSGP